MEDKIKGSSLAWIILIIFLVPILVVATSYNWVRGTNSIVTIETLNGTVSWGATNGTFTNITVSSCIIMDATHGICLENNTMVAYG